MMFAGPTTFAISPISSVRMPPDESKMPAVPPSRASVITFQAPASSSSFSHCVHSSARVLDRRVLRADLGEHGEVAREVGDQLELALARDLDRAVGDLDVRQAEARSATACTRRACPCVDDLEERAADHDRLVAQHVELALEVPRHVRRAPAELDDRDVVAGDLEDVLPGARARAPCRSRGSGRRGGRAAGQSRA